MFMYVGSLTANGDAFRPLEFQVVGVNEVQTAALASGHETRTIAEVSHSEGPQVCFPALPLES